MRQHVHFKCRMPVDKLLEKLRENRDGHRKMVEEAFDGYIVAAKREVEKRLEELRGGKAVALAFALRPPQDFTNAYDTAISMLEMTTDKDIELESDEFRSFVMDEWDWLESFSLSNKSYSKTTADYAESKGY